MPSVDSAQIDIHEEVHVRAIGNSHARNFITDNQIVSADAVRNDLVRRDSTIGRYKGWKAKLSSLMSLQRANDGVKEKKAEISNSPP